MKQFRMRLHELIDYSNSDKFAIIEHDDSMNVQVQITYRDLKRESQQVHDQLLPYQGKCIALSIRSPLLCIILMIAFDVFLI